MMGTLVYALVLLGCGDGGDACQRVGAPAAIYETRSACEARVPEYMNSDAVMKADFPEVEVRCVAKTSASAKAEMAGNRSVGSATFLSFNNRK